jgi:hypothetical protein
MADKDKTSGKASGMKSAYELALERLEKQGIERPREEAHSAETLEKIAEIRRQAEADPVTRHEDEENYVRERRRIEDDRDRKIEKLRAG